MDEEELSVTPIWGALTVGILILIPGVLIAAGGLYGMFGPPQKPFNGTAGNFLVFGGVMIAFASILIGCTMAGDRLRYRSGNPGPLPGVSDGSGSGGCASDGGGGDGDSCSS
ncbi:hypothetical protein [Methylobacterium sp. 77]|uniref:hypothetical protein n=1 Tax=Methylobacterium sp. 77 TaxID=1101192 RepID=UPI0012DC66B6|nr:hypothetical protein [Methylobacterium sp. 77]